MPDGQVVVPIGKGFAVLEVDFDRVQLLVDTGLRHWKRKQADKMQTAATDIAQVAEASLFPGNTSSFGPFIGKNSKGYPFHAERYEVLTGMMHNAQASNGRFHLSIHLLIREIDFVYLQIGWNIVFGIPPSKCLRR
jgi:hypothetical protein